MCTYDDEFDCNIAYDLRICPSRTRSTTRLYYIMRHIALSLRKVAYNINGFGKFDTIKYAPGIYTYCIAAARDI